MSTNSATQSEFNNHSEEQENSPNHAFSENRFIQDQLTAEKLKGKDCKSAALTPLWVAMDRDLEQLQISPFLNEQENLPLLQERCNRDSESAKEIPKLVFIDSRNTDGRNTDGSLKWTQETSHKGENVKYIWLSCNFNHQWDNYSRNESLHSAHWHLHLPALRLDNPWSLNQPAHHPHSPSSSHLTHKNSAWTYLTNIPSVSLTKSKKVH